MMIKSKSKLSTANVLVPDIAMHILSCLSALEEPPHYQRTICLASVLHHMKCLQGA